MSVDVAVRMEGDEDYRGAWTLRAGQLITETDYDHDAGTMRITVRDVDVSTPRGEGLDAWKGEARMSVEPSGDR